MISIVSRPGSVPETLRHLGHSLFDQLGLEEVLLTVCEPATGRVSQFHQERRPAEAVAAGGGSAIVSQPLRVRGVRLGQVELHSASPMLPASALISAAQDVVDHLASVLEQQTAPPKAA